MVCTNSCKEITIAYFYRLERTEMFMGGLMQVNAAVTICFTSILAACTVGETVERREAVVDGNLIGWNDFLAVSDLHRGSFPLGSGESIYMFVNVDEPTTQLSNGRVFVGQDCFKLWTNTGTLSDQTPEDQSLYQECLDGVAQHRNRPDNDLSRQEMVRLSREAVQTQGDCQWFGYDSALDARVRNSGGLASHSDNRLLFVKLSCD